MPQSLAKIYLHIIFSTKERIPFLADKEVCRETHAYLAGTCRELGVPPVTVGGVADHVHLICTMSRTMTVADFVRDIKRTSSSWGLSNGVTPPTTFIGRAGTAFFPSARRMSAR